MTGPVLYSQAKATGLAQPYRHSNWFLLQDTSIIDHGSDPAPQLAAVEHASQPVFICPGLTDIHCHGGQGVSFDEPNRAAEALKVHRQSGTLYMLASLVSAELPTMLSRASALAQLCQKYSQPSQLTSALIGIHAEGPFLAASHKGAHRADYLKRANLADAQALLEASQGWLKQVTLAPELDKDVLVTKFFVAHGVKVALGHTNASYRQAKEAFAAGASILTHTFNAMNPLQHRAPGPVAAALEEKEVSLEVISDGVHLHPAIVRMLFSLAAERIVLITDAMAATGCPDGNYLLGDLAVEVSDSVARLAQNGAIAGSTVTLGTAVQRAISYGVDPESAIAAASRLANRAIGYTPQQEHYLALPASPR